MNDRHEQSRAAFEALYRHPNTYDASQTVRDHIRQTNKIAWEAWCRALDYAAEQQAAPIPLTRPDRPGDWWEWCDGGWRLCTIFDGVTRLSKLWSGEPPLDGLWLPATPPPAPTVKEGGE